MRDRRGERKKRTDKLRPREREREETKSKRMGELAMEIGEGNIGKKVKKDNKIKIKERPRSLFYTTF